MVHKGRIFKPLQNASLLTEMIAGHCVSVWICIQHVQEQSFYWNAPTSQTYDLY